MSAHNVFRGDNNEPLKGRCKLCGSIVPMGSECPYHPSIKSEIVEEPIHMLYRHSAGYITTLCGYPPHNVVTNVDDVTCVVCQRYLMRGVL